MPANNQSPSDGECIAAVLAGEAARFAVLVARYESALLRAAVSRLGNHQLAEDAVQETFLCAFRSLASYDSRFSFRTWLWTILLNQCRSRYRRRQQQLKTEGTHAGDVSARAATEPSPLVRLLEQEQAQRLATLLERLPEPQADCLRLRFFGGLKFQEIADCMECSLSGAKKRVRLGLERMSAMLQQAETVSHGKLLSEPTSNELTGNPSTACSLPEWKENRT